MSNLVHNEQVKLSATFLNNTSASSQQWDLPSNCPMIDLCPDIGPFRAWTNVM